MNLEKVELFFKRNKTISIITIPLFVLTIFFSVIDFGERIVTFINDLLDYEEPFTIEIKEENLMFKRLLISKIESIKYQTPSSSSAMVKFINLPKLNNDNTPDRDDSHSILSVITPIKSYESDKVFDGTDCRFLAEKSFFDEVEMKVRIEVKSVECVDNQNIYYRYSTSDYLGAVSEVSNLGDPYIKVIDDDGYFTIDPNIKYFVQFYNPIEQFERKGISANGRF